jgi:hypothetical protein
MRIMATLLALSATVMAASVWSAWDRVDGPRVMTVVARGVSVRGLLDGNNQYAQLRDDRGETWTMHSGVETVSECDTFVMRSGLVSTDGRRELILTGADIMNRKVVR